MLQNKKRINFSVITSESYIRIYRRDLENEKKYLQSEITPSPVKDKFPGGVTRGAVCQPMIQKIEVGPHRLHPNNDENPGLRERETEGRENALWF